MQLLDPPFFCFVEPAFEFLQDDPVGGLGLPVGLGVLNRGKMLFGSEFGDEVSEPVVGELGTVVCDQRLRDSKSGEDVSFVETEDVVRGDLRKGLDLYPFREVIHVHNKELILVCPLYEQPEDIHPPPGKWPRG